MSTSDFKRDTKGKWPLTYRVLRGETIFAQCRKIEDAKLLQEALQKAKENDVNFPYE